MTDRASTLSLREPRPPLGLGIAVSVTTVAGITGLIYPLREIAPAVSTGVLYLIAVLVVSTFWGLKLGLATSLLSAAAFNFFHIPPVGEFTIAEGENWIALLTFFAAAVIAGTLAELARARAIEAAERGHEAEQTLERLLAANAEREALEAEVIEGRALKRSDELKTSLLRSVSHDLRTPLTAIVAAGEALGSERSLGDEDRRTLADAVTVEGRRLTRLVENLIELSRLEADAATPRRDWCSIEEIARAAAVPAAGEDGFRLSIDADTPLIRADAAQLERALFNVIENAHRHSGRQLVTIRARPVQDRLVVRVVDRGPGIPPERLERIFEAFNRGPAANGADGHGGSGLGLAIARGFVEANGGQIWAESLPGQGTSFVIELPLEPER
ncbi:MAG: ATP-binding protein [Actinomycetota bacterium]|nr:ATP-binding protein [Actinomycetota bacterium]